MPCWCYRATFSAAGLFDTALSCCTEADLGFHKGGCPIHLKGAPEVERRRCRGDWGLGRKFWYFCICYTKAVSFYVFPVIFNYWHCNCKPLIISLFFSNKGTLIKRAGDRTPWTPPWIRPYCRASVRGKQATVSSVAMGETYVARWQMSNLSEFLKGAPEVERRWQGVRWIAN